MTASLVPWHAQTVAALRAHRIDLVPYVPDNVLRPLLEAITADPFFTAFPTAREEEAVGILCGAWMGGRRGIALMQTSGCATLANVLASLPAVYQIPALLLVSERGTLGEFNLGQAMVWRTLRPMLDAIAIVHHTITRLDEAGPILDRAIGQALQTQAPAVLFLSPLLTGRP